MGYILIISELFLAAEYGLFFVLNLTTSSQVRGSDAGISLVVLLTVYSQTTLNLIYPNLIPTTVLTDGRPAGYQCWLHWRSHLSSKNLLKSFLRQSIFYFHLPKHVTAALHALPMQPGEVPTLFGC